MVPQYRAPERFLADCNHPKVAVASGGGAVDGPIWLCRYVLLVCVFVWGCVHVHVKGGLVIGGC